VQRLDQGIRFDEQRISTVDTERMGDQAIDAWTW
jgi:hypothetical protein